MSPSKGPPTAAPCLSVVSTGLKDFHKDEDCTWCILESESPRKLAEDKIGEPEDLQEKTVHLQPLGLPLGAKPTVASPMPLCSTHGGSKVTGQR